MHGFLIENNQNGNQIIPCPLKSLNIRLIAFWSFTTRTVSSVFGAKRIFHLVRCVRSALITPDSRRTEQCECSKREAAFGGANALCNRVHCTRLAPKCAKYIHEKVMPKWFIVYIVEMNCDCYVQMRASDYRIRILYLLWKIVSRECDGNHKATTFTHGDRDRERAQRQNIQMQWENDENYIKLMYSHIQRFNLSNDTTRARIQQLTIMLKEQEERRNERKKSPNTRLMLPMMSRCLLYNLCSMWKQTACVCVWAEKSWAKWMQGNETISNSKMPKWRKKKSW